MTTEKHEQTCNFTADVKAVLHLVTHSLYGNEEIFLRELISNASDAEDKLRFEALSNNSVYEDDPDLKIWIDTDKEARTLTIRDNGIGMNREEIIENLGTIARSGTREFLSNLSGDQAKDRNQIGQFGVGFYSAFVVADKVTVKSRHAGTPADQGVFWESNGQGDYTIADINHPKRGTEITLHLKEGKEEFLDSWRLRSIVKKYSDHILFPIVMEKSKANAEENKEREEEVVNSATALWTLPKNQIKAAEYNELYKHITHDFEDPLIYSHNRVEGKLEYVSLLYIPSKAPFDLWNKDRKQGLKLYVRRVFIMDDAEQLLPGYLRFVRGIIDSNDLPLNVSREILQSSHVIEGIRSGCVKRILDMLEDLSQKDPATYAKFWQQFGQVLKEGVAEDFANKKRIAGLLRFSSTFSDSADQTVSLTDYISRMKNGQDKIYFIAADTFNTAKNSPHLEVFRKKGIEVLLLHDRIDEWLVANLVEFEGKSLQSVAKGDLNLDNLEGKEDKENKEKSKKTEDEFTGLLKQIKDILKDKVKEVRITDRLTDSPACLVTDDQEMSIHLQNMLKSMGQELPTTQPIFEINPEHPLVLRLKSEPDEDRFSEWVWIMFDQSQLAQGTALEDPGSFVKRLNGLLLELSR